MRKPIAFAITLALALLIVTACAAPATPPPVPTAVPQPEITEISSTTIATFPKADYPAPATSTPTDSTIIDSAELLSGSDQEEILDKTKQTVKSSGWIGRIRIQIVAFSNDQDPQSWMYYNAISPKKTGDVIFFVSLNPWYAEVRTLNKDPLSLFLARQFDDRGANWEMHISRDILLSKIKQGKAKEGFLEAIDELQKATSSATPTPIVVDPGIITATPTPTPAIMSQITVPDGLGTMYIEDPKVTENEAKQIDSAIVKTGQLAGLEGLRIIIFGKDFLGKGMTEELQYELKGRDVIIVVYENIPASKLIVSPELKSIFDAEYDKGESWQHHIEGELALKAKDGLIKQGVLEALNSILKIPGILPSSTN